MKIQIPTEAQVAELVSAAGPIASGLAFERDMLRELVKAKDKLLVCYRLGKQPSESLHNTLHTLSDLLFSKDNNQ